MRIGIDAHVLGANKGGVERHVKNLIEWLPQVFSECEYYVFIRKSYRDKAWSHERVHYVTLPFSDPLIQRSVVLPWLAWSYRLDLLHVQRIVPPLCSCPVVVTIHDLLPLIHPEEHAGLRNALVRFLTPKSVRKAARIVTVSESVRNQILEMFQILPERVRVAYNGIDQDFFQTGPRMVSSAGSGPSLLCLSALEPRKNLEVALRAVSELYTRKTCQPTLTIVGGERTPDYAKRLRELAKELGIARHVSFPGYLDDQACLELMQQSDIFLSPSKSEGFGIPPLEAMSCGLPVICSDIDVYRETLGRSAKFFTVDSPLELAEVIETVWANATERDALRLAGLQRVQQFTWENMACQIAQTYKDLEIAPASFNG